jgi:V8-like Glu-specific endopeptidase
MLNLRMSDSDRIVDALGQVASTYPEGPTPYYRDLVSRVDLPANWKMNIAGMWTGDALADGRKLVRWAIARDVNPSDPRYTTLGALLSVLLQDLGLEQQNTIVALILAYDLYRDDGLVARLAARYQAPLPIPPSVGAGQPRTALGFELREPLDEVELQGLFRREPDFLDVGFLSRAIETAASICRVESNDGEALGTGFLIGRRALLTNYHVLDCAPGQDPVQKAGNLVLRFRSLTAPDGRESEGQAYRADPDQPVLRTSPVGELDYALVCVEERITRAADAPPVSYADHRLPAKGTALNILGHPLGGVMKLAVSGNGIVGVYPDAGLVQYATRALNGSSGSPCFDKSWQLVAIHHAERTTAFGAVREGVLLEPIFNEIRDLL